MTAMHGPDQQKPGHGDRTREDGLLHRAAAGISETSWQIIILAISVVIILFSVYCLSHGITIIFMHLYYLPIVLLANRYRYKGFVLSVVLSLAYIVLVLLYSPGQNEVIIGALIRFVVFIGIAAVVAYLSEQFIQSEKALKKVVDIQESSLMNANVWLMRLDIRGRVLLWNNAAERISGYAAAEVTGSKDIWKLLYPDKDYRAGITKKIEKIIAEDSFFENLETTIRTRSGEEKVISWNTRSFPVTSGQEASSIAIGIDITGRKLAEEALRKNAEELHAAYEELTASKEKLQHNLDELTRQERALRTFNAYNRSLLEASLDPLVTINHEGKIADVNISTEKITGYSREELIGTDFTNYFTEPEKAKEGYQRVFTEGTVRDYPLSIRNRDGHITPVLYNASVYRDEAGNVSGVFAAARDITDRKVAEDALMRVNQKLNVLSQLTRKDLTNQTFVLSSYLELAKNQLTGQEHIIETVEKGAQAVRLIHETIAYSKDYQDMGAKPPKWQNVKMALLLGLSHISISEIQHSIETGDLEVFADPLLEKVCQRLFENSVKHGGHVTRIRVWDTATPDGLTIFFEDDGIGIPEEKKKQVFLRGESTSASRGSLVFVREILDITGITITETGEPGKGARFEMAVPKGAYRVDLDTKDVYGRKL